MRDWKANALPYISMILVEPVMASKGEITSSMDSNPKTELLYKAISKRQDFWPNKEDALNSLKVRMPWKAWDKEILDIYVVRYH